MWHTRKTRKTIVSSDKIIGKHVFNFNKYSGESLSLKTTILHNGEYGKTGVYYEQELKLQSYLNSASFNLSEGQLTPDRLRKLADELESAIEDGLKTV